MTSVACDPERATELSAALTDIKSKVLAASGTQNSPILVAVSKLKPASDIMGCYEAGHRDFGENYANELVEKAAVLPSDIHWHFIGTLQSNKAKALANIPNLHVIQTLTSAKTATALDRQLPADRVSPLNVMLQVNTSGEASKSGLAPLHPDPGDEGDVGGEHGPSLEVIELASHIVSSCPKLHLLGVMTIGAYEASTDDAHSNPDFETLRQTRDALETALARRHAGSKWGTDGRLLMSMGMSSDFEAAIKAGSDVVRVGTSIFGQRLKQHQTTLY